MTTIVSRTPSMSASTTDDTLKLSTASTMAMLELTKTVKRNTKHLYKVSLQSLDCSFGVVTPSEKISLKEMIKQQNKLNKADVTIMYAVRTPGCPSCREHAQQLDEFVKQDRRLAVTATVKETGEADQAILEFYQDYFRNPIYKDSNWNIYDALGSRKLSMKEAMIGFFSSQKRFNQKKVVACGNKMKKINTAHFIQGGLLIFDKYGEIRYAYNEEFKEFDMDLVATAIDEIRRGYRKNSKKLSSSSVSKNTVSTSISSQSMSSSITSSASVTSSDESLTSDW